MQVDKVTGIIFGIAGIYVAIAFVAVRDFGGRVEALEGGNVTQLSVTSLNLAADETLL